MNNNDPFNNFNENKKRIADNISKSYGESQDIQKSEENDAQADLTPHQRQELIKSQIAGSFSEKSERVSDEELEKSADDFLEKGGKRAVIGEKRTFGGREYIKTASGWKFHGKGTGAKAQEHTKGALDHHVGEKTGGDKKESAGGYKFLGHKGKGMNQVAFFEKDGKIYRDPHPTGGEEISGEDNVHEVDEDHTPPEFRKKISDKDASKDKINKEFDDLVAKTSDPERKKKLEEKRKEALGTSAEAHKEDKKPTSKHISDMTATEMKAAADKLGIDVKGKTVKQVRKELTDANIDKQLAEFQAKKKEGGEESAPKHHDVSGRVSAQVDETGKHRIETKNLPEGAKHGDTVSFTVRERGKSPKIHTGTLDMSEVKEEKNQYVEGGVMKFHHIIPNSKKGKK